MATIKAYTDIEQSHKLAEILPLETANMFHFINEVDTVVGFGYKKDAAKFYSKTNFEYIPCWSLTALLSVLPFHLIINNQRYAFSMHKGLNKDGETYMFRYNVFNTDICLYSTDYYSSPIDACVDMIMHLNKLKML